MLKWILHKIQFLFLLISPFVLFAFVTGLVQKILNPDLKNLSTSDYFLGGVMILSMIVSDYFFIKNRFKRQK